MIKYLVAWAMYTLGAIAYAFYTGRSEALFAGMYFQSILVVLFLVVYLASKRYNFQRRVMDWCVMCFGLANTRDKAERSHRFIEESLELVQAAGMTKDEVLMMVNYTYNRPVGEMGQEVGGVMITLAALCNAHMIDMQTQGEVEYIRINQRKVIARIRNKQLTKPRSSPLPE